MDTRLSLLADRHRNDRAPDRSLGDAMTELY